MRDIVGGALVYGLGGVLVKPIWELMAPSGLWWPFLVLVAVQMPLAWAAGILARHGRKGDALRGVAAACLGMLVSVAVCAGLVYPSADGWFLLIVIWLSVLQGGAAILGSAVAALSASRKPSGSASA